jgi:hypothetical protein
MTHLAAPLKQGVHVAGTVAQSVEGTLSVTEHLENKIREFEQKCEWRVSLPARIIIQQLFISIFTDHIGLGGFADAAQRRKARNGAIKTLIPFLEDLATKGRPLAEEAAKKAGREIGDVREIGAIFMLQNIDVWAAKLGCPCWPR